ncbi:MAG: sugar ABC transporter permease [Defluviitaleaceae bacterium]|nr:sugar ABC transporter permease [Defluviitaleaceae bacterium]
MAIKHKSKGVSLRQKQGVWGFIFLLPWLLGFLLFFARPMWETISYAFSEVTITFYGIYSTFVGMENFRRALFIDQFFNMYMITLAFPTLVIVVIVVIFSLLAAILINGKYFGRGIVRAVFFIPIIMGANIAVAVTAGGDVVSQAAGMGMNFGGFSQYFLIEALAGTGMPPALISYVLQALSEIFSVLAQSGVPILIFLAGLQSIPTSMYEVAKIEGSTQYETFWKVTLPMISPMILLSTVYTITDLFRRHSMAGPFIPRVATDGVSPVPLLEYIRYVGFGTHNDFGLASAMSLMYIVASLVVIVVVTWVMSKAVFYYD